MSATTPDFRGWLEKNPFEKFGSVPHAGFGLGFEASIFFGANFGVAGTVVGVGIGHFLFLGNCFWPLLSLLQRFEAFQNQSFEDKITYKQAKVK